MGAFRTIYHTNYGFRENTNGLKVRFKTSTNMLTVAGCFDCFWNAFASSHQTYYFVFGWDAMPKYIDKIVESFNNTFTDIKLNLIDELDVMYTKELVTTDVAKTNAKSIILSIELSDKYNPCCKKYLYYIVHHLFRLLSLCEEVYSKSNHNAKYEFVLFNKERDFCTLVSNVNKYWLDNRYAYRGIEFRFTPEMVKLLNNIELCNDVFLKFGNQTHKQTDILFSLYYYSSLFKPISDEIALTNYMKKMDLKKFDKVFVTNGINCVGNIIGLYSIGSKDYKDYFSQKALYLYNAYLDKIFDLIIETKDHIVISNCYCIYKVSNNYIIIPNEYRHSNTCVNCSHTISSIESTLYFNLCSDCSKKIKHSRNLCSKHYLSYCYSCKEPKIPVTVLQNSKYHLNKWGVKGIIIK